MADAALRRNSGAFDPRYTGIVRGVILLSASAMAAWSVSASHQPWYLLALTAVGMVYVLATMVATAASRSGCPGSTVTTVSDILLITAIVWATGGVTSEYYLLYYLPVVGAAVRRNPRDGIAASLLGAALYTFLTLWRAGQGYVVILGYVRAATVCVSAAALVAFLSVLRREVELSQSLRVALRDSLAHIGAAYDVAHAANTGADFASVLRILLDHAREATGAEAGAIAMLRPGGELVAVPPDGTSGPRDEEGQLGFPLSELDFASDEARRAVHTNAATIAKASEGRLRDGGPGTAKGGLRQEVLHVPLTGPGGVTGVLGLVSRPGRQFSPAQVGFLTSLCSEAAVAIENAQLRSDLRHLATTDYLTGLPNRREVERLLEMEFERAARYGRPLSLLMVDADSLKAVNDGFGHPVGDEVLCALGRVLSRETRSSDRAGRMGGDEFLVILPETASADAERLAERLVQSFRAELLRSEALRQLPSDLLGLSIGVASRTSGQLAPKDLVALADAALYEAKRRGKSRVCLAPRPLPTPA
jgi:diguanylate cyclase (GGDEF)-like protein